MQKILVFTAVLLLIGFAACSSASNDKEQADAASAQEVQASVDDAEADVVPVKEFSVEEAAGLDTATFAAGCFWCVEAVFERVKGVKDVVSGYAGGSKPNPTYKEVAAGRTDYAEAVQIYFDPEIITYDELLKIFFGTHDPTQLNRQGPDVGKQYRTAIFYHDNAQYKKATAYKQELDASGKYDKPVVTEINSYDRFYIAEDYHQNYYEINPNDPYVRAVAMPKIEKFKKNYKEYWKDKYL